nr:MAG: helix-turn-helix domain protein [Bacteriophage sp.]
MDKVKVLLWEQRTSKGFTLMQLAEKSGIGKSTLNNIENEKVSPTLFQLEMIAATLGVKITDLFESEYK